MLILRNKQYSDSDAKAIPLFVIPGVGIGAGAGYLIGKDSPKPIREAVQKAKIEADKESAEILKQTKKVEEELKKLGKTKIKRAFRGETKKYEELREKLGKLRKEIRTGERAKKKVEEVKGELIEKAKKSYTKKSVAIGAASGLAASGIGYGIYKSIKNKKNDNSEK